MSFQQNDFISLRWILRSVIVRSYGSSMFSMFTTVTLAYTHSSLHPDQPLLFFVFWQQSNVGWWRTTSLQFSEVVPWWLELWSIISCTWDIFCMSSFEKCLFRSIDYFLSRRLVYFTVKLFKLFAYSGYQLLVRCMACKYFLSFCSISIPSDDYFLWYSKALCFN